MLSNKLFKINNLVIHLDDHAQFKIKITTVK